MQKIHRIVFSAVAAFTILGSATLLTADPLFSLFLPGLGMFNVLDVEVQGFTQVDAWERYDSASGVHLGVENGVYRAYTPNAGFVWGLNAAEHTDVVLEVNVTPLSIHGDTAAGVMCRADVSSNGNGYYFMINSNGYVSIGAGEGDAIVPLVDWQPSTAVRVGLDQNIIRAACLGDQLAMYVNDDLVATVQDGRFTTGYAGLAVAAGSASVDMAFDDVTLYSVALR